MNVLERYKLKSLKDRVKRFHKQIIEYYMKVKTQI